MTLLLAVLALTLMDLRVAFHVHTTFSDGEHTVEDIARRAAGEGIDAVVLADHFQSDIRYGLPLFRESLALTIRPPALAPQDLDRYIEHAREVEMRTGVLILPGVELTPFYHWRGSLLEGDLTLHSAHRHLVAVLAAEPDTARLGRRLLSTGAPASRGYGWGSLALLWPLAPLGWAVFRLRHPSQITIRTASFVIRSRRRRHLPLLVLLACGFLLARAWPFDVPRFGPYESDPGTRPYQAAVDLARAEGCLTFWAHPETSTSFRHARYPVSYRSDIYPHFISETRGATGFASLYEGYRQTASPGGSWDEALIAFARGERSDPIWAVGELDLHREGEAGGKFLGEVETVLKVEGRSHDSILQGLANGSGYVVYQEKESRVILERFVVSCGDRGAGMGERLAATGRSCLVELELHREGERSPHPVELVLVRDGVSFGTAVLPAGERRLEGRWPVEIPSNEISVLRVLGTSGPRTILHGNPVFVAGMEVGS